MKSFKELDLAIDNPTATILSEGEKKPVEKKTAKPRAKKEKPAVEDFKPVVKENKSKRLLVLMKPSTFEKIEKKAKACGISTNEYINQVLEAIK